MAALRECINLTPGPDDQVQKTIMGVGTRHFEAAFNKVKPSVSKKVRNKLANCKDEYRMDYEGKESWQTA